ncbi:MAG: hypothetical protein J6P16_05750 [Eubacterium sp.]|nr:hypothetical protein [Eubacterium sp.]
MGTIVTWIIVFAILCGCIFIWSYMLHRGPHSDEGGSLPSCDGNCFSCAKNVGNKISNPDDCDDHETQMSETERVRQR